MRRLLVLGSAPCMEQDISGLDLKAYDVAAVNRAGVRFPGPVRWWVTYHPQTMVDERWMARRSELGWNMDFSIVLHQRHRWAEKLAREAGIPMEHFTGPGRTGSSTLLAALFGLQAQGYDAVLVAGAPLEGAYEGFQGGWTEAKHILAGRVFSMSGWTKTFLEGLNHGAATH